MEISIMRKAFHPNIVSLHFIYEDSSNIYFILDYMSGGDLFHRIIMKNRFSENVSSKLMKNLLSALEYLHRKDVIYRDLKPQNILFEREDCDFSIKINNFYLACDASDSQNFRCGSPGYVAPEILKKKPYSKKVDIFSAGVILYTLLSGRAPFAGKKPGEIYLKNKECKIYFQDVYWRNISKEGVDCVLKFTDPDPEFRPTASEALNLNWFKIELSNSVQPQILHASSNDGGISAELMKRMNRVRGAEENKKKEEDQSLSESQRKVLNNNSKNFLSRLRGFDSFLNG
jgi:serine/threonine protein kinase